MKNYVYMLACPDNPWWVDTDHPGELISEMVEASKPVAYETMRKHCEGLADWLLWKGVVTDRCGMVKALKTSDWISFNKSWYAGLPCYYVCWSGIEFVWIDRLELEDRDIEIQAPPWVRGVDPRWEHTVHFPGASFKIFRCF